MLGQLIASSLSSNGVAISVEILETSVSDDGKLTVWGHKDRLEPQVIIQRDKFIFHDRVPGLWLKILMVTFVGEAPRPARAIGLFEQGRVHNRIIIRL